MEKFFAKHPKIQKALAALLIVLIFVPTFFISTPPKQTEAWGMITFSPAEWAAQLKDLAGQAWKQIQIIAARKILNAMTQRTINWINSGFSGNPFYLENTEAFFKDIVKYEVRNLVDTYAYNKTKFPFGKQFALNTINAYQKQLEDNTAYSLSKVINDPVYLESYRNDFNVGGWNGFLINTQYPQNNYIGFTMLATEDIARKIDGLSTTKAQQVQDTLEKSQGFLAPKKCLDTKADGKTPTGYNNGKNEFVQPSFDQKKYNDANPYNCGDGSTPEDIACEKKWEADLVKAKATWAETNTCKNLAVTTPGAVIADQIKTTLTSKIRQSELSQAVGNSLTAVFDALANKLIGDGLKKLSGLVESPTASSFDFKSGLQAPSSGFGDNQICIDTCLAGGTNPEQCGQSCVSVTGGGTTGGPDPLGFFPAGGGTPTTTNPPTGGPCVGNNPKCTCAEGVSTYDVYVNALEAAEDRAYPNGLPSGTSPRTAQTAVCAAYTGPGTCRPASQEDELIIEGLPAPYVTLSIDFLAGNPYYLWAHAVAACEAGVQ